MAIIKIVPMPGVPGPIGLTPSLLVTEANHSEDALATTLYLTDANKFFRINNAESQTVVQIPSNATTAIPVGTEIKIFLQDSAMFVTRENTDVVIYADGGTSTGEWYVPGNVSGLYTLLKTNTDEWVISGYNLLLD